MTKRNSDILKELKNKTILVTGGGGSLGSIIIQKILEYPVKSVRALDIDEHSLFKLKRLVKDDRLRLLLGNIQDKERIIMAGKDVDIVIHTAAVKNIEISEFNPIETIETNINGTVNMIKMAIENKPEKFLNISTDKSVESSTLYGTTKQLGERLTSWAGKHIVTTKFASIRLGNVFETRGNVFEIWDEEIKNGQSISVTESSMERYFIHVDEAVELILKSLKIINEGEIIVPKMKIFKIKDLANKKSKNQKVIGIRQGEKIKEILLTKTEKKNSIERKDMWIINQYK